MADKLDKYVQDAKALGLSKEQIKKSLLKHGWRESDINAAIDRVFPYTGDSIVSERRDIPEGEISGYALAGLIFAFVFPLLGLILSIIGMNKIKNNPNLRGNTLAILGVVISVSLTILATIVLLDAAGVISIGFGSQLGMGVEEPEEIFEEPIVSDEPIVITGSAVAVPEEPEEPPKKTVQEKIEETIHFEEWDGYGLKDILKFDNAELNSKKEIVISFQNIAGDDVQVKGMKASYVFNRTDSMMCKSTQRKTIPKARYEHFELKCDYIPGDQELMMELDIDYLYDMEPYLGKGEFPLKIGE